VPEFAAGSVADFAPGVIRAVDANGRPIAVVRVDERFYAFDNFCTHEGVTFTSGYGVLAKNRIVCMLHSSAFDVETGEPLAGPAPEPLQTYAVTVRGDEVFVEVPV
jgi:3-phenylpropionate/trans-cinnamate dioxygenase ferredoxin subunit